MSSQLDPQVESFLHDLSSAGVPPLYRQSLREARETYREICTVESPEAVADVTDRRVPGPNGDVPLRLYTPAGANGSALPTIVFFHGGGWMLGDLETYDALCRAVANAAGCLVASVDYRLAPEHPFPAALEDCYAATRWMAGEGERVGADGDALALLGDSAGGTLAAGVSLLARDRDGPAIDYQALAYPATNHAFDTDSYEANAQGYFLTRPDMERFWDRYLPSDADGRHPYASPLRAADLSDLPPTFVLTCGFDPLRDDGRALAERLDEAGVLDRHVDYAGVIHGFLTMLADPEIDRAREGVEEIGDALRTALTE